MKNKKILFLLIFVLIIILIFIFFIIKNFVTIDNTDVLEYTPAEEISPNQMRETIVTLFFVDNNNNLKSEGRLIDSLLLAQNPYKEIVSLLISGPKSNDLKTCFPENTKILDATIEKHCVTLDFSDDILNFKDESQKLNIINCLVNTLTQLNDVNSIKLRVNNEENEIFNDTY